MSPPLLIIVTGPSGVGKTTIVEDLKAADEARQIPSHYHIALTATTRPPRPGEEEAVDYYFVTPEQFAEMESKGELLENAVVYGHRYGVPKEPIREALKAGKDVLLRTDIQGAFYIKSLHPQAVTVFLAPPSWEELERRLRQRGLDGVEEIEKRLRVAREELQRMHEFDHLVVNDSVKKTVERIESIIAEEKAKGLEGIEI